MRIRRRLPIILGVIVVAAVLALLVQLRKHAPPEPARLLPSADGFFYINLQWMRRANLAGNLPPVTHEPEYEQFIQATGFQFERDLDEAAFAIHFSPTAPQNMDEARFSEVFVGRIDGEKLNAYLRKLSSEVEDYHSVSVYNIPLEGRTLRVAILAVDTVAASNNPDPGVIHGMIDRSRKLASPFGGPQFLRQYYKRVPLASVTWAILHERFGHSTIAALRAALGNNDANMPWSPPEVHPSDGFRTHVVDAPATTESDVPLVARLGQTLAALTVDYERTSAVSLPLAAVVLHALDREPAAMRELPARTGISKEAIAMAVKWLAKFKFVTVADRTAQLTGKGRAALAEADETADGSKLRAALEAVLAQTEALAVGLTPPPGCWRASKPYVTQTNRFLADPTGALPRQPFVLHRGGWPDGS